MQKCTKGVPSQLPRLSFRPPLFSLFVQSDARALVCRACHSQCARTGCLPAGTQTNINHILQLSRCPARGAVCPETVNHLKNTKKKITPPGLKSQRNPASPNWHDWSPETNNSERCQSRKTFLFCGRVENYFRGVRDIPASGGVASAKGWSAGQVGCASSEGCMTRQLHCFIPSRDGRAAMTYIQGCRMKN